MSVPRAVGLARLWGRSRGRRIRFRDAVPVRRDRRDLRRQFRRAARAETAERKARTLALLWRLSANRVPVSVVTPGVRDTERIVEFRDGTRLLLAAARSDTADLRLLDPGAFRHPGWLAQARPCFAHRRFRLWFASANRKDPVEVLAAVESAAEVSPR
jgi:hypothetical protein